MFGLQSETHIGVRFCSFFFNLSSCLCMCVSAHYISTFEGILYAGLSAFCNSVKYNCVVIFTSLSCSSLVCWKKAKRGVTYSTQWWVMRDALWDCVYTLVYITQYIHAHLLYVYIVMYGYISLIKCIRNCWNTEKHKVQKVTDRPKLIINSVIRLKMKHEATNYYLHYLLFSQFFF